MGYSENSVISFFNQVKNKMYYEIYLHKNSFSKANNNSEMVCTLTFISEKDI